MAYKAKTLSGAQARVRMLENLMKERVKLIDQLWKDRELLARLSADTPQFDNPLEVAAAKAVRDRVLKK